MLESERNYTAHEALVHGNCRCKEGLHARSSTKDQRYQSQNYEHEEENLRDTCCSGRYPSEAENRCNQCDDEKDYSPVQHVEYLSLCVTCFKHSRRVCWGVLQGAGQLAKLLLEAGESTGFSVEMGAVEQRARRKSLEHGISKILGVWRW
jgi:hypothetical protein